jgi:HK97 family phage major capsid protein
MSDVIKQLEGVAELVTGFQETHTKELEAIRADNADLKTRLEAVEAGKTRPTKTSPQRPAGFKSFPTTHGTVYELDAATKMADVLPPEKTPEVSLERWLAATVAGEKCGDAEALEYAREQKQMVTTTTGVLIPGEYISDWIDLLRSNMVLNGAGMRTVTMLQKTQTHSAVTADPTASWHTEAGSISAANPTFAARTLTAHTLVTRCTASVELAQDSPDFGNQLAAVMSRAMAVELDRVGLLGSGTPPEPRGIRNTSGRNTVTGVGVPTDYSKMIEGVGKLLASNVSLEDATRVAIMAPAIWATFEGLATGIASDKTQLARPKSLENTRFLVTGSIPETSPQTYTTFLGDFRDLVLGIRREASIEMLKLDTYAGNLVLEFVGYLRADYMLARPASFCTLEGMASS